MIDFQLEQWIMYIYHYLFPHYYQRKKRKVKNFLKRYLSTDKIDVFFQILDTISQQMNEDVEISFTSDPAATSLEEIIYTYPGIFAISIYRVAHELWKMSIVLLPRMMSEYVHSKTGIDIHPASKIGNSFFIDHGTGIVIGETTIIGKNVKIYQGVTLGAISLEDGQKLKGKKRHPTIEDNVTIYANATILGDIIIGENVTIGGNVFLTNSIAKNQLVRMKKQEIEIKEKL